MAAMMCSSAMLARTTAPRLSVRSRAVKCAAAKPARQAPVRKSHNESMKKVAPVLGGVAALGLAPPAARSALDAASGRCAAPVTPRGVANKSIGVHTSLSETRRRMPAEAFERGETSAAGGAPGFFEPLATREKERLARLADAMARDLAGRVRDDACAALRAASGERISGAGSSPQ